MKRHAQQFDLVLSYPQWQGSGRSQHLLRGGLAIAELCENIAPMERVPLSDRAGDLSGVNRFEALLAQMDAAREILERCQPSRLLVAGGDCAIDIPVIDYLVGRYPDITVVWVDSHYDANTPETSPSGNLHGMPVAAIMGAAPLEMRPRLRHPLRPERFRYVWANVSDDGDRAFQAANRLTWLARDERILGPVHVHFDLDVLDPEEFPHVAYPEVTGISTSSAVDLLRQLAHESEIVGLSITEFAPANDRDAQDGMRTISALLDAIML